MFVNVTTKSAQHTHARMITIIVEKKSKLKSYTKWLPPWREGRITCLWIKSVFDCLTIGIIHETMVVHMTWVWTFFNNHIYIYTYTQPSTQSVPPLLSPEIYCPNLTMTSQLYICIYTQPSNPICPTTTFSWDILPQSHHDLTIIYMYIYTAFYPICPTTTFSWDILPQSHHDLTIIYMYIYTAF